MFSPVFFVLVRGPVTVVIEGVLTVVLSSLVPVFFVLVRCPCDQNPPLTRSGVLRMQKLSTPLVGAKGYQIFPLFKPGVGI